MRKEESYSMMDLVEGVNYVADEYPLNVYIREGEHLLCDGTPVSHVYRTRTFRIKRLTFADLIVGSIIYRSDKYGQDCRVLAFYRDTAVMGCNGSVFALDDASFLNNCWAKR